MRWIYHEGYDYGRGLPGEPREIHGFVLRKPSEIRDRLLAAGVFREADAERPEPVTERDLLAVHTRAVVARLRDPAAVAEAIEVPEAAMLPRELVWRAVVAPQLLAAGGTCAALRAAAGGEWAANLSGGFHHARRDRSHGFCLVNDVALAVAALRRVGRSPRIAIVDLDLHQGDGNADLFADDPLVFTASAHEELLFPMPKLRSDLDLGLAPEVGGAEYLRALEGLLAEVGRRFEPEIVVYLAGSDPYEGDPLGSLRLDEAALLARDERVARFARDLGCALVVLPAGGYSKKSPAITAAGFAAIARAAG